MSGVLHVHSEHSLKQCALSIRELVRGAKERGYDAVALTDSGNMAGIASFLNVAKEEGIKGVPGVELYVKGKDVYTLNLMAKDYTGYVGLCKALSEANRTLLDGRPVLPFERLDEFFGNGKPYHAHVVATSSGINGELMRSALEYEQKTRQAEELKKKAEEAKQRDPREIKRNIENCMNEIQDLEEKKKEVMRLANKVFSKKEEHLAKLEGSRDHVEAELLLLMERAQSEAAKKDLVNISGKLRRRQKKLEALKTELEICETAMDERLGFLTAAKDTEEEADMLEVQYNVETCARRYRKIFGDDYYIELMFHGLEEEAVAAEPLSRAAQGLGIRTVISNDVHMLSDTKEDLLKWQVIQTLKDNKWKELPYQAREYWLKDRESLGLMLEGLYPSEMIDQSFENMDKIFDSCSFEWPGGHHYPVYACKDGATPEQCLEELVRSNIPVLFKGNSWDEAHEARLRQELPVIQKTGYSDYTLILSDILEKGRALRTDEAPCRYIGPGRGSGAGSLVNYLARITDIDPIRYGLIFERYLNVERISPPDIDSDIASSIRDDLVHYITETYSNKEGSVGVCSIATKQRYAPRAAVKAAGRVLSARMFGNAASLYPAADKISKAIPQGDSLEDCADSLGEMFQDDVSQEIIGLAGLICECLSGYGTHAAGIIISDSGDVTDYAPLMNMGTDEEPVWNIQYDMVESEALGLLKLDALGLTTLDTNANIVRRIYRTTGKKIDLGDIPFEREVFRSIYSRGDTNGVFQCESAGMKKMWMQLRPDSIEDIIAGISLFRPGPMDFIPDYIKGKHNPSGIRYLTPKLEPILKQTYGCIVYQEQVMRIVRDLAGYSMGRSDLVRRAMSKKKESVMAAERKNFIYGNSEEGIPGCKANGIPEDVAGKIYDLMVDFAKYAFNKSHAAAYAIVSYQSAWLKFHYPKEFLIETLNTVDTKDIPIFIDECRRRGYVVNGPDINRSDVGFTEHSGEIYFGLGSVKGVKKAAQKIIAARGQGFTSFLDYLVNSKANKAVTKMLIKGGAFDAFCASRAGLLAIFDGMAEVVAKAAKLKKKIAETENKLSDGKGRSKAETVRLEQMLGRDKRILADIEKRLLEIPMPASFPEPLQERLEDEKEALACYISTHPLDAYEDASLDIMPVLALDPGTEAAIMGVVSGYRTFRRKKDGREMAIFDLSDRTGKIRVLCFPQMFEQSREELADDAVLKVHGKVRADQVNADVLVFMAEDITSPARNRRQLVVMKQNDEDWEQNVMPILTQFQQKHGHQVLAYNMSTGVLEVTNIYVDANALGTRLDCMLTEQYLTVGNGGGKD